MAKTFTSPALLDPATLQKHKILCVDDEPQELFMLEVVLKGQFNIVTASSGQEALQKLMESPITILLSDQGMPDMTGVELCERVKVLYPALQRILLTGFDDAKTVIDAINRGGVSRYLTKPFDKDELTFVLKEGIARAELEHTVMQMRRAIQQREQERRILHDLANLVLPIDLCTRALEHHLASAEQLDMDALRAELQTLTQAVQMLKELYEERKATATQVHSRPHSVRDVVENVLSVYRPNLREAIRIEINCPQDLSFYADSFHISRILFNLLENSSKAFHEGFTGERVIEISAHEEGSSVVIRLQDNGAGISPDVRHRLFHSGVTNRTASGGSGVGLAICRELAVANGGHIELISQPGPGAAFQLVIPKSEI